MSPKLQDCSFRQWTNFLKATFFFCGLYKKHLTVSLSIDNDNYIDKHDDDSAVSHAVEHDKEYSAAWKLYGKALVGASRNEQAIDIYQQGIDIAENKGDIQAAKEMKIFLKRLL